MKNVLFCVIFSISYLPNIVYSGSIRQDLTIVRTCNTTDPVDIRILNDYLINHNPNRLNTKAHQELSMDRHGGFKVHNIKVWMRQTELSEPETELLIEKCITPEFTDPCTRAQHFTECFWTNHQGSLGSNHRHSLHSIIHKNNIE